MSHDSTGFMLAHLLAIFNVGTMTQDMDFFLPVL